VNWSVRVRSGGRRRAVAYARQHRFEVGGAVAFDEAEDAVSSLEYALGALAAELVTGFTERARRRRLEVGGVEAVVTGELNNPLTVLDVMGEEGHPGLERIGVKLYVASGAPPEQIRRVLEETRERASLARTLRGVVALDVELEVVP
jgi:uncharacterized OsmC-like protein